VPSDLLKHPVITLLPLSGIDAHATPAVAQTANPATTITLAPERRNTDARMIQPPNVLAAVVRGRYGTTPVGRIGHSPYGLWTTPVRQAHAAASTHPRTPSFR
jgi:hypothetical protein